MNKKKNYKKSNVSVKRLLLLFVLSVSMVIGYSTFASACETSFTGQQFQKASNCSFGDVSKFAVFAKEFISCVDMEGNVAAKCATLNDTHMGLSTNVTGHAISYIEKFKYNSNVSCEFLKTENCVKPLIIGNEYNITKNESDKRWNIGCGDKAFYFTPISKCENVVNIKNSSYVIDFDAQFQVLTSLSKKMFAIQTSPCIKKCMDGCNGKITCGNGLNVLNMTMAEYNSMKDFNIEINANAQLIINLTDYNGQELDNKVCINGNRHSYKDLAGNVLWNFGAYCGEVLFKETTLGGIFAPCGKVNIISTHNGNVIANCVINSCGEIHKNDFCININNKDVTPTCTPETNAPETNAPETKVPETEQPNTCNPETVAPETDSPKETVAPTKAPEKIEDVVETEAPKETETPKDKDKTPKTGDNTPIVVVSIIAGVALISLVVVLVIKKKKNK